MFKAIFLSDEKNSYIINRVYNDHSIKKIEEYAKIYPQIIYKEIMKEHESQLKETEIVFSTWGMLKLSEEEINCFLPNLRVVFYAAGSVQSFARPFLKRKIRIVSAWAANGVPVAEYTMAQILLANKGFFQNTSKIKQDYDLSKKYSNTFPGNYFVKVGILGAGMIGGKVIELLKHFNIEILVYDPFLTEEKAKKLGVIKSTLEEVFTSCQTISNHIANLPSTVGILDGRLFNLMKENATFINTGRGAQVIESDLINALKASPARTAILDVTDPEPPIKESDLYKMDNVILTTHIAGSMNKEIERMGCYMADEFVQYITGEELKYEISLKMLEKMA